MERKRLWFSIGCVVICAVAAVMWFASRPSRASQSPEALYADGNLSGTLAALSTMRHPPDAQQRAHSHFLRANCYRRLGMNREFHTEIQRMRALPEAADLLNLATAMFKIQHGELQDSPQTLVDVLQSAGALESDAWSVVIQGTFASGKLEVAQQLLEQWSTQRSDQTQDAPAELAYLTAVSFNIAGEREQAEDKWIATLEQHPQHELSWLALAELYSRPPNVRFLHSQRVLEQLSAQFPHNPDVGVRLARVRRRLANAERSLPQLNSADTESELLEKANVEFDLGRYSQSVATLKKLGLSTADQFRQLTDAAFDRSLRGEGETAGELTQRVSWGATAFALSGAPTIAHTILEDAADRTARLRRLQDLTNRESAASKGDSYSDEMTRTLSLATPFAGRPLERFLPEESPVAPSHGLLLYQERCAHCHGRSGRGDGRAACNLFPAPRNFRDEPLRLVSTQNGVASDEDLARIIQHGEPGTSMPAFTELSESQVSSLVEVVRQWINDGLREQYKRQAAVADEGNNAPKEEWLANRSKPGPVLMVPPWTSTPERVARGKEMFGSAGCANCHALGSEPPLTKTPMFDSLGRPVNAPRLDTDPFHGSDHAEQIYRRIALGIPGTPHPALASTDPGEIESLVAYIQSIRSTTAVRTNYQRAAIRVGQPSSAEN